MKKTQTILILTMLLVLAALAGCTTSAAMQPQETQPVSIAELAPTADPADPTVPVATLPPEKLSPEEAQAIALADAGLTAQNVTGLRAKYEIDDRIPEYEVDFRSGDYEYDYTIHAESGAILARGKEYDPPATRPQETVPAATESVKPVPDQSTVSDKITADRAVTIALNHVGLNRADVTRLEVEYDVDDGVPEYEVEFHHEKTEYHLEIHAETGAILDFDRDK